MRIINKMCLSLGMEIKIDKSDSDVIPLIIMFDRTNWTLQVSDIFKGDPNDIFGAIQGDVFTLLKRDKFRMVDFEFIILNTTHIGFTIAENTKYKISE